jgi:ACS family hexuronate transporter-like MFS transporter
MAGGNVQRWLICVLLFLATVLNYLDRQVMALNAEHILQEFSLSKEHFGEVLAAFRYSYALAQFFGGWMVDALGPYRMYPAAVGLWSAAGLLTGLAPTFNLLRGCRFLLGIGEAFNWPCALHVTHRIFPRERRSLANGIFNSGTAAGAILAPLIVTGLTLNYGWRASFVFTGMLGGLWILAWFWIARPLRGEMAPSSAGTAMLALARRKEFWLLAVSAIIINSVSYYLADWIPLYLKTERGFSFAGGNLISLFVYAGLDVGNLSIGWLAGKTGIRKSLLLCCVLMSSAAGVGLVPNSYVAVGMMLLTALGVAGFLVIYLTLVQNLDSLRVGMAAGMLGGLGNLAYGVVSPYIGKLADAELSSLSFVCIGVLPWLALSAIWSVAPRKEPA